jgi:hypothetical protein
LSPEVLEALGWAERVREALFEAARALAALARAVATIIVRLARLAARLLTRHLRGRIMAAPKMSGSATQVTVVCGGRQYRFAAARFTLTPGPREFEFTATGTGGVDIAPVATAAPATPPAPPTVPTVTLAPGQSYLYTGKDGAVWHLNAGPHPVLLDPVSGVRTPINPARAAAAPATPAAPDALTLHRELATMQGGTVEGRRVCFDRPAVGEEHGLVHVRGRYLADPGHVPAAGTIVLVRLELAGGRRCKFAALVERVGPIGDVTYQSCGLVDLDGAPAAPAAELHPVHRWDGPRGWTRVRMRELRKGDVFRMDGHTYRAESDGRDLTPADCAPGRAFVPGEGFVQGIPCADPSARVTASTPPVTPPCTVTGAPVAPADPLAALRAALDATGPGRQTVGVEPSATGWGVSFEAPRLVGAGAAHALAGAFATLCGEDFPAGTRLNHQVSLRDGGRLEFASVVTGSGKPLPNHREIRVAYESRGPVTITHADGTETVVR